jgi:hypothetical protein
MRDNIDYRLLERFRTLQRVNEPPTGQTEQKLVAAAASQRRLPALDLRD